MEKFSTSRNEIPLGEIPLGELVSSFAHKIDNPKYDLSYQSSIVVGIDPLPSINYPDIEKEIGERIPTLDKTNLDNLTQRLNQIIVNPNRYIKNELASTIFNFGMAIGQRRENLQQNRPNPSK
jgi:hypothetical protein